MDYKRIIKSRTVRIKIMQALSFVPDDLMIKFQYWIKTGNKLNLKNPQRFTEKLQWYKINYRDPVMKQCVDKYEVRKYVEDCGLGEILNECYGVFNTPDEIDFDALPNRFVLKDTLGGGGNSVLVVRDKRKEDLEQLRKVMKKWVEEPLNTKNPGREWVYDNNPHRIVVEKYLESADGDLPDYKFFCFNGKVFALYTTRNYAKDHNKGELGFLTPDFTLMDVQRTDSFLPMNKQPECPLNYDRMLQFAEIMAKRFPHVRVDFYNIEGKIRFGELTFFTASGYMTFEPDEFDFMMGKAFELPEKNH